MTGKFELTRRQVSIYILFLLSTATFYYMYSYTDFIYQAPNLIETFDILEYPPTGFLVYSEQCEIPDVDPFDATVKDMIELQETLNCSKTYPELTYSIDNRLFINYNVLTQFRNIDIKSGLYCCYSGIYRDSDGSTDDGVRVDNNCIQFQQNTTISHEFIMVNCSTKQNVTFYVNFHSFVQDKPEIEKRCQAIRQVSKIQDWYSVLIIGVDSVSRLNMHRQLPRTLKYLKNQMDAMEMFGYNKVGDNTFPNLVPILTGYHQEELSFVCRNNEKDIMDRCPLLWKNYMNVGYRSFYAEDTPHISTFNYIKPGFYKQPTDYYIRPFILEAEDKIGWDKRLNCHLCIGPKSETEAILSWLKKFGKNFNNRSYFALAWINSLTHDYLNYGSFGDDFYFKFLQNLHSAGDLNRTIVVFMSDHGMRWGSIRKTYIGRLEERLPVLLISLPTTFRQRYPDLTAKIKLNAHRLTTPFDLHATLKHIIDLSKTFYISTESVPVELVANFSKRAKSLFTDIPKNRSCSEAAIAQHWCTCHQSHEISVNDLEVIHTADYILQSINYIVKSNEKCSKLKMDKILNARLRAPSDHLKASKEYDIFDYTVTVKTVPGDGQFEATVRFVPQKHTHNLLGGISRLNLYGNQSICVQDSNLRKYCYCK